VKNYTNSQIKSIVRRLCKIGKEMEDLRIGLMSGNCNDNAFLVDEETGEVLGGIIGPEGVWKGGDPPTYKRNGKLYCPDYSPEAESFFKTLPKTP